MFDSLRPRALLRRVGARVRHQIARTALGLPASLQLRLAGGGPIVVDGLTLHPELQMMFALRRAVRAKSLTHGEAEQCRRRVRRESLEQAGPLVEVGAVRDFTIPGPGGALPVRHYAPRRRPAAPGSTGGREPLLVYFHGGGFVVGDLDTTDPLCRLLCRHGGVHVLSIDYRLAPEHPFPAAFDDARAAFLWACDNAASLGADPRRVGIGGDSAGAHLSAVLAIDLARQHKETADVRTPSIQLLIYPAIDRRVVRPSIELFAEGFFLERRDIEKFQGWYAGHLKEEEPRTAPLLAPNHAGLPHAVIVTAGFDPLRDEGEEYAALLEAAGNTVVARRFDDLIHGFANMTGVSAAARDAVIETAGVMRAVFESADLDARKQRPHLRSIA